MVGPLVEYHMMGWHGWNGWSGLVALGVDFTMRMKNKIPRADEHQQLLQRVELHGSWSF